MTLSLNQSEAVVTADRGGLDDTGQIEPPRRVSITSDIPPIFPKAG